MGDGGFDSPHKNAGKTVDRGQSDAESDATTTRGVLEAGLDDPDLAVIVAGWSKLSADARRAVVELVEAELGAVALGRER